MTLGGVRSLGSRLVGVRKMTTGKANVHPGYASTEPIKQRFSIEDGTPVYVKGGAFDRIAYGVTAAACLLAVGLNIKTYYDLSLK